ncbi:MAG TPA: M50 family metallopeptidase, partial [Candidatus Paceibacterota bacterium]
KIWSKKFGGTLYTLNAIPFGGFVKIFGEDAHSEEITEENKKNSFVYKPKWIQAAVLVAGVSMNIIFAWLCVSLGFMIGLPSPTDYSGFGKVTDPKLVITEVLPESAAHIAKLLPGDQILRVVTTVGDVDEAHANLLPEKVKEVIQKSTGDIEITYKRGDLPEDTVSVTPKYDPETKTRLAGIAMDTMGLLKLSPPLALLEGLRTTYLLTEQTVIGLFGFIVGIFTFTSDFSQVSGPVGIAGVVGQASDLGFVYLLMITTLISINLAIINLLPFPALDGGRLLFVFIEAISRKTISPKFVKITNTVGFVLLLILMLVVTGHDILKLL